MSILKVVFLHQNFKRGPRIHCPPRLGASWRQILHTKYAFWESCLPRSQRHTTLFVQLNEAAAILNQSLMLVTLVPKNYYKSLKCVSRMMPKWTKQEFNPAIVHPSILGLFVNFFSSRLIIILHINATDNSTKPSIHKFFENFVQFGQIHRWLSSLKMASSRTTLLCYYAFFLVYLWLWHFLYSVGPHPVLSLHIYTFVVSRAFMAGVASQVGDADSSRAPDLTSGLQGSVNVHRGALLLVPQWQCISSFVFYI